MFVVRKADVNQLVGFNKLVARPTAPRPNLDPHLPNSRLRVTPKLQIKGGCLLHGSP